MSADDDFVHGHDIRILNKVVRSRAKDMEIEDNRSLSCCSHLNERFSEYNSLMSEEVEILQNLISNDNRGKLLANFWTHELKNDVQKQHQDSSSQPLSYTSSIPSTLHLSPEPPPVLFIGPKSTILTDSHIRSIAVNLPLKLQFSKWRLIYSVLSHGADIISFYKLTKGINHSLVVVNTLQNEVFGGFVAEPWKNSLDYYGSGESFVFNIEKNYKNSVSIYQWTYENMLFMWSTGDQVAMGGGEDGFAFVLDRDFFSGSSYRSATFQNKPFSRSDHFEIANVEVWAFDSCLF